MSIIAVKISFLWGDEHGVYAKTSFVVSVTSWNLRNSMLNFTRVILYMNICITNIHIVQRLCDANIGILHYSSVFAHPFTSFFKPQTISSTRVSNNMTSFLNYVTAMVRALFTWRGSYINQWRFFMLPAWKVRRGYLVMSVRLFVRNSVPLTKCDILSLGDDTEPNLDFKFIYVFITLHLLDMPMGRGQSHILTLLPLGASVFHKHISSSSYI